METPIMVLAARLRTLELQLTPENEAERAALDTLAIDDQARTSLIEVAVFLESAAQVVASLNQNTLRGI